MSYCEQKDLADFPNITEWAQKEGHFYKKGPSFTYCWSQNESISIPLPTEHLLL